MLGSTHFIRSGALRSASILQLESVASRTSDRLNGFHHLKQINPTRAYHKNIVEHFENPRNVGSLDKNDRSVGTGIVGAPACGDVMKLQIKVNDDNEIVDAKFKTFGCGSAIASSSTATEWIIGKTVDDAVKLTNKDIAAHLKLPAIKLHCSMLAEDAVKKAVTDWNNKQKSNVNK